MKPLIGIGADVLALGTERERAFTFMTYVESVKRAGGVPLLIPPQPDNVDDLIAELDGLILAGGEDCDPAAYGEEKLDCVQPMDPRRQSNEIELARAARQRGLPTLGICLGSQVMNVAAGGSLYQDLHQQMGTSLTHASLPSDRAEHDIRVESSSILASIIGTDHIETVVNSSHHQAVKKVGEGLVANAFAPDGVIEGIEDRAHPFYVGVQWHPEDMHGEPTAVALFGALIKAAVRHRAARQAGDTVVTASSE